MRHHKHHSSLMFILTSALAASPLMISMHGVVAGDESIREVKLQFSTQEGWQAFPGNRPGVGDTTSKLEHIEDLDAHRELSDGDRRNILALSDYLIDKRYDWVPRGAAADDLGQYGHSLAIPALLAVIRDESDNIDVRARAILALGQIRDKRVVPYIIEEGLASGNNHLILSSLERSTALFPMFRRS